MSSVRSKCFFGLSSAVLSWLDRTLEWISSIRPLRYFEVIYARGSQHRSAFDILGTCLFVLLIEVVHVAIEDLNEQPGACQSDWRDMGRKTYSTDTAESMQASATRSARCKHSSTRLPSR